MTKCSPGKNQKRESRKNEITKMSTCYIPIDAKFDADFKNVYFNVNILNI